MENTRPSKLFEITTQYFKGKARLELGEYFNNRTLVRLIDPEGYPVMTISVNIPEAPFLLPRHFFLKDWSENAGIYQQLLSLGLIRDLDFAWPCGFCEAHLVELTFKDWK